MSEKEVREEADVGTCVEGGARFVWRWFLVLHREGESSEDVLFLPGVVDVLYQID